MFYKINNVVQLKNTYTPNVKELILFIILPIIISLCIFNPFEKIELYPIQEENLVLTYSLDFDDYTKPGFKNNFAEIFNIPLGFNWYGLYLEDHGHVIDVRTGESVGNFKYIVNFEGRNVVIDKSQKFIGDVKINRNYNLTPAAILVLTPNKMLETEYIQYEQSPHFYVQPEITSFFSKIFVFLLVWDGTVLIFSEVYNRIFYELKLDSKSKIEPIDKKKSKRKNK